MRTPNAIVLTSTLLLGVFAHAATPLDRDGIERWIAAYSELEAWSDTEPHGDPEHAASDDSAVPDFTGISRAYRESVADQPAAVEIIERHGFDDATEWADVSARITLALMAIAMQDAQPEIEAATAEALREMERNPEFSDADRDRIRERLRQSRDAGAHLVDEARDEDLPAVRAMQQELAQVLGFDDYPEAD